MHSSSQFSRSSKSFAFLWFLQQIFRHRSIFVSRRNHANANESCWLKEEIRKPFFFTDFVLKTKISLVQKSMEFAAICDDLFWKASTSGSKCVKLSRCCYFFYVFPPSLRQNGLRNFNGIFRLLRRN